MCKNKTSACPVTTRLSIDQFKKPYRLVAATDIVSIHFHPVASGFLCPVESLVGLLDELVELLCVL